MGFVALRRIKKQSPALSGRGFAGVGLVLSLLFVVAAPTQWLAYRWQVRAEARKFSEIYFQDLAKREPEKAFQLALPPQQRQSLKDAEQLWGFYRNNQKMRQGLENFVKAPVVRTLLALGPQASIRFYETIDQEGDEGNRDIVKQRYAVTYEEEGEKKTFFVDVQIDASGACRPHRRLVDLSARTGDRPGQRPLSYNWVAPQGDVERRNAPRLRSRGRKCGDSDPRDRRRGALLRH